MLDPATVTDPADDRNRTGPAAAVTHVRINGAFIVRAGAIVAKGRQDGRFAPTPHEA